MAKIARYPGNLKAFAADALGTERTIFGDTAQADDLASNITADFLRGWGIVGVNENPTKQDFNGLAFTLGQLVSYIHQAGVPEWDDEQEYHEHSMTNRNGNIYICKTNSHVSVTPPESDTTNWFKWLSQSDIGTADGDLVLKEDIPEISNPAGTVIWHAADSAPTGYLKANGATISRTTYAALYAAIGTTFGAGDGSTTFEIPDLRGEFVRGWDDAKGVDTGRALGSSQADEFESHIHRITDEGGLIDSTGTGANALFESGSSGVFDTGATGGTETRPRNIALLACIKY